MNTNHKIDYSRRNLWLSMAITVVLAMAAAPSFADNYKGGKNGPNVLPINSSPFGQTYEEWVIDFTKWIYSIPLNINPLVAGNLNCTQPQHGKVWFVTTSGEGAECDVPVGKAIFIHVKMYPDTYPCPDPNTAYLRKYIYIINNIHKAKG